MTAPVVITLKLDIGVRLVAQVLNVPSDGACFFYCLTAALSHHSMSFVIDPLIPKDSGCLRRYICEQLKKYSEVRIPGLGVTPLEYFLTEYSGSARVRQHLHNSDYNANLVQRGEDPNMKPLFVNSFGNYLEWMMHPRTQVDGLIVAFAAFFLKINLTVYTRAISEVQLETSDVVEVRHLISMGFSKSAAEQVLLETAGNMEAAIDRLLQRESTQSAASEANQDIKDVWHEQPYHCPSNGINISLIQDGCHFQLIVHKELSSSPFFDLMSIGFQRQKAEQALVEANGDLEAPRVILPDIPEELFSSPEENASAVSIQTRDQLYHVCDSVLKRNFLGLPQHFHLDVRIPNGTDAKFYASLLDSFVFPELDMASYRIVCFRFDDDTQVAHSGTIAELSHRNMKMQFFTQLWERITQKSVTHIVLERC